MDEGSSLKSNKSKFESIDAVLGTGAELGTTYLFLLEQQEIAKPPVNFFVYNSLFEKQTVVDGDYDSSLNALVISGLAAGTYMVSYSSVSTGTKYDLNKPHIPYMSLEIQGEGNIDKETNQVLMYFDKVSLNAVMNFTFIQDKIINVPLSFNIIDDKNNYLMFED